MFLKFDLPKARFLNFPQNSTLSHIGLFLIIGDCVYWNSCWSYFSFSEIFGFSSKFEFHSVSNRIKARLKIELGCTNFQMAFLHYPNPVKTRLQRHYQTSWVKEEIFLRNRWIQGIIQIQDKCKTFFDSSKLVSITWDIKEL